MKIVIAHNRYRSAVPSGENRVVDQEGQALRDRGHEVISFERRSDDIEHWPRARRAAVPAQVVWSREAQRALTATLREHKPDVVHVHNIYPLLSTSILYACRDMSVPVVATIHNYKLTCASGDFFRAGAVCHDCTPGLPWAGLKHGCYRGSRVATAPVALAIGAHRPAWKSMVAAYIMISAAQRDLLSGLGLPADRVFVRHNLIPGRSVQDTSRENTVVYAGRLFEAKGLRLLMAGWDRYATAPDHRGLRLVIVGAGPLEAEIAAWAARRPEVSLIGQVDAQRCAELMASARAIVMPSTWEETFGLVAVEAMALGVPPIAADHGSFPELITHGTDGVLFRHGDPAALAAAIADVERNPGRYEAYGKQARLTYERRFDPDCSIEQLLEIYRYATMHPTGSA